ncbi:MAG: helix-turn-helix domain-containing protein [Candidatus Hydrogenedentota bacterium]|jgi:DNA-binding NtrC family response regulator
MVSIAIFVQDTIQRLTLKTLLEAEGYRITEAPEDAQVMFTDAETWRDLNLSDAPTILIASVSEIPTAIEAMVAGAWGYIFVPFISREAALAVSRALGGNAPSDLQPVQADLRTMESVEFEHIALALRLCHGNQAKAARALNIGRNTLWRKLKKMEQSNPNE